MACETVTKGFSPQRTQKEEKGLPRMDADERGLQGEEEEAFSENRKPLTTKGTKDTEENQGLPLMNTDDTDFGEQVERTAAGMCYARMLKCTPFWDDLGCSGIPG